MAIGPAPGVLPRRLLAHLTDLVDPEGAGDRPPPARRGFLEASIDGQRWSACAGVWVACRHGLLAIAGADADGSVLSLAVEVDRGPGIQRVGASAANGTLTVDGESWFATAKLGSGWILPARIGPRIVAGTFELIVGRRHGADIRSARAIRSGRFAVEIPV